MFTTKPRPLLGAQPPRGGTALAGSLSTWYSWNIIRSGSVRKVMDTARSKPPPACCKQIRNDGPQAGSPTAPPKRCACAAVGGLDLPSVASLCVSQDTTQRSSCSAAAAPYLRRHRQAWRSSFTLLAAVGSIYTCAPQTTLLGLSAAAPVGRTLPRRLLDRPAALASPACSRASILPAAASVLVRGSPLYG